MRLIVNCLRNGQGIQTYEQNHLGTGQQVKHSYLYADRRALSLAWLRTAAAIINLFNRGRTEGKGGKRPIFLGLGVLFIRQGEWLEIVPGPPVSEALGT